MRPKVKYHVIYKHRTEYPVSVMCRFFGVSRSGYYAFVHRQGKPEKDAALAEVIAQQWERSYRTYGYRRMWLWLKHQNIFCNPKTVLRIMKKYELLSEIRRRRKWQQMGQQVHKYKNLLNREFHADRPNSKWVTDISYIHTKQGILYLSMIRDLYDNTIVAYKTGTEQTVNLVLDTIHLAMKQVKKKAAAELQLHSDQGFQYTSQAYFKLTKQYGITPSMSRKGNPYDNAMAENFFSILKTECIYRHRPATFAQANEIIDRYIYFYNHERIQLKTGEAPLKTYFSFQGAFCTVRIIWSSSKLDRRFLLAAHTFFEVKKPHGGSLCRVQGTKHQVAGRYGFPGPFQVVIGTNCDGQNGAVLLCVAHRNDAVVFWRYSHTTVPFLSSSV